MEIKKKDMTEISEGMSFAEEDIGTNAITLAINLRHKFFTLPGHHYCKFLNRLYFFAVPLFVDKKVAGCLAVFNIDQNIKSEMAVITELLGYQISRELMMASQKEVNQFIKIKLNNKQIIILELLARGLTDKAVAIELGISIDTVRYHKRCIFNKLGATNIVEAVVKAYKLNLISTDQIHL